MRALSGLPYWRLSGFYFVFFLTLGGIIPYWPLYLQSIHMTPAEIGILSAVVVVTKIFSSIIWGWWADHTGQRLRVIRYTSLLSVLSFSLVLFYESFWSLFIILFVFSFFWSAIMPQIEASTFSHLGESSNSYTVVRIWGSTSFIIVVLALGRYFDHYPIVHLLPLLIGSMVFVYLQSLCIAETPAVVVKTDAFLSILLRPHVMTLMVVCFLVQAAHGPYYTFFSIYLEGQGYSKNFIGIAWAVGVCAEVIVYAFVHKIIDRFGLWWLFIVTLILATIRWLFIAWFVDHILILLLAQCLHAASFGTYHAVAIQYIHREFKGQHQVRGQALYSSISFGAGLALGSLGSGYLWGIIGASATYLVAAVISAIAVVIAWYGLEK